MANFDLGLGNRFRYALDVPLSGTTTSEYGTFMATLQASPGAPFRWQDNSFDVVNDPDFGVPGPGLGVSAVAFNTSSRIQRGWGKSIQTFVSSPNGINFTCWFYVDTLTEGVIFTLGGNRLYGGVAVRSEGSLLTLYDTYPGFKVVLTSKEYEGSDLGYWAIGMEARSVANTLLWSRRSATAVTAGQWHHLLITLSKDLASSEAFMYLDGVDAWGGTDWSAFSNLLSPTSHNSVCIADFNQYDGINSGVEGQGRFVGRLASVGVNFAKCVSTSEGSNGLMPMPRILRQYWRGATFGSPLMRPSPVPFRAPPSLGASSLRQRLSGWLQ